MALTNPTNLALKGHRVLVIVENPTTFDANYRVQVARLQDIGIDWNVPTQIDYEIGNIDPVGSGSDPVEPRATLNLNGVSTRLEAILCGKPFTTLARAEGIGSTSLILASAAQAAGFTNGTSIAVGRGASAEVATVASQSSASLVVSALANTHALGDIVTVHALTGADLASQNGIKVIQLMANQSVNNPPLDADRLGQRWLTGGAIANLAYNFTVGGAITENFSIEGQDIFENSSASYSWGDYNTTDPGSIRGKDVILTLGGSGLTSDVLYRLQSFNIGISIALTKVREIGNRAIAGVLADPPTVTFSFDILEADLQPDGLIGNVSGTQTKYDVLQALDTYVRVYDGRLTRSAIGVAQTTKPVKSFKLDNVVLNTGGVRNVVRGMATKRFSGQIQTSDTSGTGGITIYAGDIA